MADIKLHQDAIVLALKGIRKLEIPKPGEYESLPRTMANEPLDDIRVAMDSRVKDEVRKLNYEYVACESSRDELMFLDTTPFHKKYTNGVEVLKPAYDYDANEVIYIPV